MFRTLAVSLLSLLLCASVAFAEKPLVVASDPTFPPNEMLNKDKEIVGFSIDYIKAVGKEAGFDVQVKNIAWDGIFAALASNQVDVIAASVSITDKRKKAMLFTDPYYELHQAVVLPLGKEIKDLEELAGKRVGGQIGTTAMVQTIPASKIKMIVKTYDEVGLAFEDLAKGNLDAVMCDDPVAKYYANTKDEYRDKFHIGLVTGEPEFYGFALRKNDKELAQKLNAGHQGRSGKGHRKADPREVVRHQLTRLTQQNRGGAFRGRRLLFLCRHGKFFYSAQADSSPLRDSWPPRLSGKGATRWAGHGFFTSSVLRTFRSGPW